MAASILLYARRIDSCNDRRELDIADEYEQNPGEISVDQYALCMVSSQCSKVRAIRPLQGVGAHYWLGTRTRSIEMHTSRASPHNA